MQHPLYVALVWHMHQPFYRDLRTGEIPLPWVRLHAAKDYLHMAEVLARHPGMHLTINMVPSLTEQMLAWVNHQEQDELARLGEARFWSDAEKRVILNLCYSISWDNIIRRYPRYSELLDRRPEALAKPGAFSNGDYRDLIAWFNLAWIDPNWLERDRVLAAMVAKRHGYSSADIRTIHDKQREIAAGVLPLYRKLSQRGQLEIAASPYYHPILPLLLDTGSARRASPGLPLPRLSYRAAEDGAAQLHSAVQAHTQHFGTAPRGLWPSEGAVSFELLPFIAAAGFNWLASDEIVLFRSLGRPLYRDGSGMVQQPHTLYQPYRLMAGAELGPSIIFRDHELSDRIGFLYHRFPGKQAAEDMVYRLIEIRNRLNDPEHPYLVSIILDGENCWENYEHNGDVFLNALYAMLSERAARGELQPVTVSEYLAEHPSGGTLARLQTGSWINGDLTTWIGDPEHNRAWDALARTRAHLITHGAECEPQNGHGAGTGGPSGAGDLDRPASAADGESAGQTGKPGGTAGWSAADQASQAPVAGGGAGQSEQADEPVDGAGAASEAGAAGEAGGAATRPDLARAWRALYAAEGSDWFWWYSHRNRSDQDAVFDRLFRNDLAAVYDALGHEVPDWLNLPINHAPARATGRGAADFISPQLSAEPYPGEEWALAAALQPAGASTGSMQRAAGLIERLFVGHDRHSLYLRLDLREELSGFDIAIYLGAAPGQPVNQRTRDRESQPGSDGFALGWEVELASGHSAPFLYRAAGHDQWQAMGPVAAATGPKVLELSLPMAVLGLELRQNVAVVLTLAQHGVVVAQLPEQGMSTFALEQF